MLIWAILRGIDADDVGSPRWPYSCKAFSKMPGLIGVPSCSMVSLGNEQRTPAALSALYFGSTALRFLRSSKLKSLFT